MREGRRSKIDLGNRNRRAPPEGACPSPVWGCEKAVGVRSGSLGPELQVREARQGSGAGTDRRLGPRRTQGLGTRLASSGRQHDLCRQRVLP